MKARSLAAVLLISAGCGAEGDGAEAPIDDAGTDVDSGGDGDESYEDASVEPVCRTNPVDAEASEQIQAALCIAMSEPGEFGCVGDEAQVTCTSAAGNIVIAFDAAGKGTARYATATSEIGTVVAGDDGFDLTLAEGKTGVCTVSGEVAELCVY